MSNGPAVWGTVKQTGHTNSSTEAEYVALGKSNREVAYTSNLITDMGFTPAVPAIIYCDNKAAIFLSDNAKFSERSKHIPLQYHAIREQIKLKNIKIEYVPSLDNLADFFTKPLPVKDFLRLRSIVMNL